MKTYKTQAEVNADLDRDGNLTIEGDVTFLCDVVILGNINAWDITALNITARHINVRDVIAGNIDAHHINAENISYDSKCVAIETFFCKSTKGRSEKTLHYCLYSEIVFLAENEMKTIEELKEEIKALQAQIETLEGLKFKLGYVYFYIMNDGVVDSVIWRGDEFDKACLEMGNVFKTKQDALDEVRRMKIRQKLKVMTGGWIPDWDNITQLKYYIHYNYLQKKFCQDYSAFCKGTIQIYFPSLEIAQTVIDTMNDDLKFLIGVK